MDRLLRAWQAHHMPRRWPAGPQHQPPRPRRLPRAMSRHQDEIVAIDAEVVAIKGTPEEVETLARAAGLYGRKGNRPAMADDEDHIMTGVYIGVGLLLAAGAGYLAWRYLLDDTQKQQLLNKGKDLVADGLTKGKRAVRDARTHIPL